MGLLRLFLWPWGRIGRGPFLMGLLSLALLGAALGRSAARQPPDQMAHLLPVLIVIAVLVVASILTLVIKRLHDRNRSGWWSPLLIAPLLGYSAAAASGKLETIPYAPALQVGAALALLWLVADLAVAAGLPDTNHYGPPPNPDIDK